MVAAQVIQLSIVAGVSFGTAQILGPGERGRASFLLLLANLGAGVGSLSLHIGVLHAVRAGRVGAPVEGLRIATCSAALVTMAIPAVLLLDLSPGILSSTEYAIAVAAAAVGIVNMYVQRWIQTSNHHRHYRNLVILQVSVYLLLVAGFLLGTISALDILLAWITATILSLGLGLCYFPYPGAPRSRIHWDVFGHSIRAHTAVWLNQLAYRADLLILGLLGRATELGWYALATAAAEVIWALAEALSLAVMAGAADHRTADRRRVLALSSRIYGRLALVTAIVLIGLGHFVFTYLLPAYKASELLLVILLPGVVLGGYSRLYLSNLLIRGEQRAAIVVGGMVSSLAVLYLPMIRWQGAKGAAFASSALYLTQFLLLRRAERRA